MLELSDTLCDGVVDVQLVGNGEGGSGRVDGEEGALALAAVSAAAALGISCSSCCCCSEPVDYI